VADVDQDLPWLQDLVGEFEVLKAASILQQAVSWQVWVTIGMGYVLAQGRSEGRELGETTIVGLDDELFGVSQRLVILQLRQRVKQMEHPVNGILGQLLWLAVLMEVDQLLAEDLQYFGVKLGVMD
jgi:hypothetical protein